MACTLFFAVSHLLILLLFIHECRSCSLSIHLDYNHTGEDHKVPLPFTYNPEAEYGHCEPTCKNNQTILNCRHDQVLSISPINHTIVVKLSDRPGVDDLINYPCKAYHAIVNANYASFPPSPWVNFTFLGKSEAYMGCPNEAENFRWGSSSYNSTTCISIESIIYGPFKDGRFPEFPPFPPGCIQFRTYNMADQCQISGSFSDGSHKNKKKLLKIILPSVLPAIVVVLILLAVYWRRRKSKSGSRIISRARSVPERRVTNGVTVFSYAELQEATNNFDAAKELGEGGFGIVYHGKLRDGREVAVKRMYEKNYKQVEQFNNEIRILTSLQHPNLVTLYGCTSRHSRELLLVYEYIPNKTLADHLHGDQTKSALLSWPKRMNIAIETATALSYLHFKEVIHRDIKTDNILLDSNFRAKVADFGLSRLFPADVTHVSTAPQGTPGYLDPEYHQCYHLSDKSDVYSFGVVLVELISSLPAVDLGRHRHEVNLSNYAMNRIQCSAFGELVDAKLGFETDFKVRRMTTLVAELAFRCLQGERELRPSMEEVLEELKSLESADYDELEAEEIGYEK